MFKEYLNSATINGVHYMNKKGQSKLSTAYWTLIFIVMLMCSITLSVYLNIRYLSIPTATGELSKRINVYDVPFPAIMICNNNRISKSALMNFTNNLLLTKFNATVTIMGTSNASEIYDSLLTISHIYCLEYDNFDEDHNFLELQRTERNKVHTLLMNVYGNEQYPLDDILFKLTPSCNNTLKRCIWNDKKIDCGTIFIERRSYLGVCCAFNYLRPNSTMLRTYFSTNETVPIVKNLFVPGYGTKYGLKVLFDQLIDDYAFSVRSHLGSSILVHEPEMFPDQKSGGVNERFLIPTEEKYLSIEPYIVQGEPTLRQYPSSTRKCVFRDEMTSIFKNLYSLAECLLLCRLSNLMDTCGCHPPQYPNIRNLRVCLLNDIDCLLYWKKLWFSNKNVIDDDDDDDHIQRMASKMESSSSYGNTQLCPDCLSRCSITKYRIRNAGSFFESNYTNTKLTERIHKINDSILHVYFSKKNYIIYGQSPIYDWFDLLSLFGGILSITFGASLLSVVEFLYFLSGRFFIKCNWNTIQNMKHHKKAINKNKLIMNSNYIWLD